MFVLTWKANCPEKSYMPHECIRLSVFLTASGLSTRSPVIGQMPPLARVAAMTLALSQVTSMEHSWRITQKNSLYDSSVAGFLQWIMAVWDHGRRKEGVGRRKVTSQRFTKQKKKKELANVGLFQFTNEDVWVRLNTLIALWWLASVSVKSLTSSII